jgi:hypothetical protein
MDSNSDYSIQSIQFVCKYHLPFFPYSISKLISALSYSKAIIIITNTTTTTTTTTTQ